MDGYQLKEEQKPGRQKTKALARHRPGEANNQNNRLTAPAYKNIQLLGSLDTPGCWMTMTVQDQFRQFTSHLLMKHVSSPREILTNLPY